jgi:hypothetical protein
MGATASVASVLRTLTKERIYLIGRELGFPVSRDVVKEEQVASFSRRGGLELTELLHRMTRAELRAACRAHARSAGERARAPLMARLIGNGTTVEQVRRWLRPRRGTDDTGPARGKIARVRQRQYLIERVVVDGRPEGHTLVQMVCMDDDAPGRSLEVLWERELGAEVVEPEVDGLGDVVALDEASVFSAYLHSMKWRSVTATDGRLFQSPFRAGIQIYNHQLVPLLAALALPRANLFIADDVGLGKTIEAGLIMQELLLRQRVQKLLIVCPASVCLQWRDEMWRRFGTRFEIYNRAFVARRREERGFGVNPWTTFPRFIISYQTLRRPEYWEPLLTDLEERAPRSLLVLDEAHTAAPASASVYAVDTKVGRAVRSLAPRFEHRLFLSATPHNGHSNSFSALLEILDPQRFTRGVDVQSQDLEPVMVRRLKKDIREMGSVPLPERRVHQIDLTWDDKIGAWSQAWDGGRPGSVGRASGTELRLAELLSAYRGSVTIRKKRGELVLINLQKRLISSVEAFFRTLTKHAEGQGAAASAATVAETDDGGEGAPIGGDADDESEAGQPEDVLEADAAEVIRRRSRALAAESDHARQLLKDMLRLAGAHRHEPGPRTLALLDWIRKNQCPAVSPGGAAPNASTRDRAWSDRRVIVFTEYADTKRHLAQILRGACADTDDGELRISEFQGGMSDDARAEVQRAFNGPPRVYPVRILLCTDAAREGVNLQGHCADLFHFDVPWNPARMEQRNGRIDRTMQPSPEVRCHYFFYPQRVEDQVLRTLVRKVAVIQEELGSLGEVLHEEMARALETGGLTERTRLALERAALPPERVSAARDQLEAVRLDKARNRMRQQADDASRVFERSHELLGFREEHLRDAIDVGLRLAGLSPLSPHAGSPGVFLLPAMPESWAPTLDVLRRPRGRDESFWDWRSTPPMPVTFRPLDTITDDIHHLHLEHPFVQRMLARFSSGHDLSRVTVVRSDGDGLVRAIAFGRLSLFGAGATRLHEELVAVAAPWYEARNPRHLTPFASEADRKALERLETTLAEPGAGKVSAAVKKRLLASAASDFALLWRHVREEADSREQDARKKLSVRGGREAEELRRILRQQRLAIERSLHKQMPLFGPRDGDQREQWQEDRKHLGDRLSKLDLELTSEPADIEASYQVVLRRIEPVGLVYLWPASK